MNKLEVVPIGIVRNTITQTGMPGSKEMESTIVLSDTIPAGAYNEIEVFSHLEIVYFFELHGSPFDQQQKPEKEKKSSPAQTKKYGSSLFGNSIVKLVKKEGNTIVVCGLDAINGTIILDIKPFMSEITPAEPVIRPYWSKKV